MIKRKICVVITARPSYSRVKTVLEAIERHQNLELQIIVAASALLNRYGSPVNTIIRDGFKVTAQIYNIIEGDSLQGAPTSTGLGIIELSSTFERIKPDIVVTIADRFETMATAISSSYMNIPLAHIQGGEVTGNIDEKVRHAITKLSDYHFVASNDAYERVLRLGEDPSLVFNTGCPSIDLAKNIKNNPTLDFNPFEKYPGVGNKFDYFGDYLVVLQHPVTTEHNEAQKQIEETLMAISLRKIPTFWFWPNMDVGSSGTSKGLRLYRESKTMKEGEIYFFKNMDPDDFLKLIYNARVLIGNSSVGIRECSFLGVPVVNIGSRQNRRLKGANVVDVGSSKEQIVNAIDKSMKKGRYKSNNLYGNGNSGETIANILSDVEIKFHKTIVY